MLSCKGCGAVLLRGEIRCSACGLAVTGDTTPDTGDSPLSGSYRIARVDHEDNVVVSQAKKKASRKPAAKQKPAKEKKKKPRKVFKAPEPEPEVIPELESGLELDPGPVAAPPPGIGEYKEMVDFDLDDDEVALDLISELDQDGVALDGASLPPTPKASPEPPAPPGAKPPSPATANVSAKPLPADESAEPRMFDLSEEPAALQPLDVDSDPPQLPISRLEPPDDGFEAAIEQPPDDGFEAAIEQPPDDGFEAAIRQPRDEATQSPPPERDPPPLPPLDPGRGQEG
jgi:hypothetical protein